MWDRQEGGVHVGRVYQICYMLQGLCEPCIVRHDMSLSLYVCYVYMFG
jgi:hypothetical protein